MGQLVTFTTTAAGGSTSPIIFTLETSMMIKMMLTIFLFISSNLLKTDADCSPHYGAEPCLFLPALPGKVPSCARPGLTYCEHSPHYPKELIKHLISLWRYDKRTLFLDETTEEFNSYIHNHAKEQFKPLPVYGPPENQIPEPIYIPKYPFMSNYDFVGNRYMPTQQIERNNKTYPDFLRYSNRSPYHQKQEEVSTNQLYNYQPMYQQQQVGYYQPSSGYYQQPQSFAQQPQNNYNYYYNAKDWWQRPIRDVKSQLKTRNKRSSDLRKNLRNLATLSSASSNITNSFVHDRKKRQTNPAAQTLCTSRTQYIMPEAAMNSQGNWMYVVNVQDGNSKYTQLVRSETCTSQQCNGLCNLPSGYNSRCEQKYIQKRLVALEGTGNNLYTDLFWIPSCCVCTITQG